MRSKILVIASLAAVAMVVFMVIAALAVFALVGSYAVQAEEVQAAPVIIEPVSQPEAEVVKPVNQYEKVEYAAGVGGCPYRHQVKNQLVKQSEEKTSDQLLTQVVQ